MRAYAPNGLEILGTYEMCPARAEVSFHRRDDGTIAYEHTGGSEMFWDGMETVTKEGETVFLDEHGEEWTRDQLEFREED